MHEADETQKVKDPRDELRERIAARAAKIEAEGKERVEAARKLAALAKPEVLDDLKKLIKAAEKLGEAYPPEVAEAFRIPPVLAEVAEYVRGAEARIRGRLGLELKNACAAAGLDFTVLSREDPVEVRIPPLLLRLDFHRGRAELLFAREVVATTRPEAKAILAARERALRSLESGFDAAKFFDDCLAAYRAALASADRAEGDRVEILEFLPYLAVRRQTRKFRGNPVKESFRSYGKARFAYDVLRLRREGRLTRGGLRLNFGVATGSSASKKDRVVYLEDEHGDGEYKLTVFFTPVGAQ